MTYLFVRLTIKIGSQCNYFMQWRTYKYFPCVWTFMNLKILFERFQIIIQFITKVLQHYLNSRKWSLIFPIYISVNLSIKRFYCLFHSQLNINGIILYLDRFLNIQICHSLFLVLNLWNLKFCITNLMFVCTNNH